MGKITWFEWAFAPVGLFAIVHFLLTGKLFL
jgi:hypothetical protein